MALLVPFFLIPISYNAITPIEPEILSAQTDNPNHAQDEDENKNQNIINETAQTDQNATQNTAEHATDQTTKSTPTTEQPTSKPTNPTTSTPQTTTKTTSPKESTPCTNFYARIIFSNNKTLCITEKQGTNHDAGANIISDIQNSGKIGTKNTFLYAHSNIIGSTIKNENVTSFKIIITKTNQIYSYTIKKRDIYACTVQNQVCTNLENKGMVNAIRPAQYLSTESALSIMTCHGQALPGKSATHRYVIYAVLN